MGSNTSIGSPTELVPLSLEERDYLGVELFTVRDSNGNEHKKFAMRARAITFDTGCRAPGSQRYLIAETEAWDHWSGPSSSAHSFWARLLETNYDTKKERYVVPATDSNVIITFRSWDKSRILFANAETKHLFYELADAFSIGESVAVQAAKFKLDGIVPSLPEFWQERKDAPLSPYQRTAVRLSLDVPGYALFMDRGTGKTACAIQRTNTLAQMLDRGEIDGGIRNKDGSKMLRVLVIVPKNVRLNWQREFEKFSHVQGRVTTLRGGLARRVSKIAQAARSQDGDKFSVLIASYDGVRTTIDYLSMIPWDDVITDESHYYKDPNTDRFKTLARLRETSTRRLSLTGTPIGNSPMDLWSQLEFLREGGSGLSSRKAFKLFYGQYERVENGAQGISKLVGLQNIPLLQERLSRMSFSVTKEEAGLCLPDKVRSIVEVQMTAYQAETYNSLQDDLALEIEDKMSGEIVDEVTVKNVLTMLLRLAQVSSGYITYDAKIDPDTGTVVQPKREVELSPENPKIMALLDLLQDEERDPKGKTIVWCHFIHNIKTISAYLTERGIKHGCYYGGTSSDERDKLVDAFNCDPDFKVLVCNPQTAGEGLNLLGYDLKNPTTSDTYCDMEVFVSSGWSAILRAQAEDRAHRRGTRMPVQVIDLVVPGTIDEEILSRITEKRVMAETVSDLKSTLSRVLGRKVEEE